jgi:hypothetical protein
MYEIARSSCIRMIRDTIEQYGDKATYYDFDNHAEGKSLPNTALFGLTGFSMTQNDQFHDLTFGVGIMTRGDENLGQMIKYIDLFYNRLAVQERFKIYRLDGSEAGYDVVIFDGTSASPMTRVDQRPAQTVTCAARMGVAGFSL